MTSSKHEPVPDEHATAFKLLAEAIDECLVADRKEGEARAQGDATAIRVYAKRRAFFGQEWRSLNAEARRQKLLPPGQQNTLEPLENCGTELGNQAHG